jgi:DNA polymerase I-like protein with 3'-5' exonuclease and polymerase domains
VRILCNLSPDDNLYRQNLTFLLKEHGLIGVATTKDYEISSLQTIAGQAQCEAILLTNPNTLTKLLGDKATLDKYRGTRINYTIPVIVANPVEHIHTVLHGKWLLNSDLRKFKRIKEPVQQFDFRVLDTEEAFHEGLGFLKNCELISFDIETDAAPQITCISFTGLHRDGSIEVFLLPLVDFDHVHYQTPEELADAIVFMKAVLALDVAKVAFNGIYDSQYCIKYHAYPNWYLLDAMILAWCEYSELPRALDFAASIHCYDYFFWKDEADLCKSKKDLRGYWAYCCKDSWYTMRVLLSLLSQLKPYQITNYKKTFKQTFPCLYTAYEGVAVNDTKRKELKIEAEIKKQQTLTDLQKMSCNPEFNPGSWQQVHEFIYEVIGGKKPENTKGAGTASPVLNRVAMQHPLLARICDLIITYREEAKAISTYYEFELSSNGRLLYNLDPTGTDTGRFACKASSFWVGTQIQNIPPYLKPALVADSAYTLVEGDKNKSEARCVGYLARASKLIAALEDLEKDFYKVCATLFFGIPYEKVTKALRNDVTKHIIHGTHYVMGPEPFIDRVTPKKMYEAITMTGSSLRNLKEFAKYLLSLYHAAHPELKKTWYPAIKDELRNTSRMVSPDGWTRHFFGDVDKNHKVFRSAVAHAPQHLSVAIINEEMWWIHQELVIPSNGEFRYKGQIHDSHFAQILTTKLDFYLPKFKEILTRTKMEVHGRTMVLPADIKIGKTWGEYDEKKNPEGMREWKPSVSTS